jgi:pimeloyl-ACP methyl ester carboxylesterase
MRLVMVALGVTGLGLLVAAFGGGGAGDGALVQSVAAAPNAPDAPLTCENGSQESGAVYRICMPDVWQAGEDDLFVYAHGYVAFNRPVGIPEDQMSLPDMGALTVDQVVNALGYAFAATSYYTNGLVVPGAIEDVVDLVDVFVEKHGQPKRIVLVGVSEGGLITSLAVEQHPEIFDGGLAMCGPYGDFGTQINVLGDFRVVFDYFFPELMPSPPITIPDWLIETWETSYFSETVKPVIEDPANALSITMLLKVVDMPPYKFLPPTSTISMERLLWYNVFATNDGKAKLGGQPFDNQDRVYAGSGSTHYDTRINQAVPRFNADPEALAELAAHYQPRGRLAVPLVTLHTTRDFLVPYWHATLYQSRTHAMGYGAFHQHLTVDRFGHCSFKQNEVINAFNALMTMVADPPVNATGMTVMPQAETLLVYTDTQGLTTTVRIPVGAVTATTTLTYTAVPKLQAPAGLVFARHAFVLDAYRGRPGQDSVLLPMFRFQKPVTVTVHYADVDLVGLQESTLGLYYRQGDTWVDATTTCTPTSMYHRRDADNVLSLPICQTGQFAVLGQGMAYTVYLPLVMR